MDQQKPLSVGNILFILLLSSFAVSLCNAACTHPVYCTGPLLDAVQRAQIFNDSKTFVDMPMKYPPEQTLSLFKQINASSREALIEFVEENFYPAGSDLIDVNPSDWVPNPSFLNALVNDSSIYKFGASIHYKWQVLVRAWNTSFCDDCHSHLSVDYPFVIAGSRFREFYYWDSYWTVQGLLVSGMYNTTKGLLINFLELVKDIGFLPNGGRVYYLNRSQPPFLTQMVEKYFAATKDLEFLEYAVPILNAEYEYFMNNTSVEPEQGYTLNRFYVINNAPRPESYLVDVTLAESVDSDYVPFLYQQLATGAETGWDFSSRWMEHQPNLNSLITTEKVPVDLNSILYKNEVLLSGFYNILNEPDMAKLYEQRAQQRLKAMQDLLWNEQTQIWNDKYLNGTFDARFYASNFVPFWAGAYSYLSNDQVTAIVKSMSEMFSYPGGFPTSILQTGQQWDFPNGWAPLQYFAIEGLNNIAATDGLDGKLRDQCSELAFQLASKWLTSNYCAWNATGMMFEKYDVTTRGVPGGGGEYVVQDGFGWTNGVALHLLQKYAHRFTLDTCGQ